MRTGWSEKEPVFSDGLSLRSVEIFEIVCKR